VLVSEGWVASLTRGQDMTDQMARFLAADSMVTGEPRWTSVDFSDKDPGTFLDFLDIVEPLDPSVEKDVDRIVARMRGDEDPADLGALEGLRAD
jgi:hypothetical protein